jgi:hypothetical protein
VWVAAEEEGFHHQPGAGVERPESASEPFVPDAKQFLEPVLDDLLELVGGWAWTIGRRGGGGRGHADAGPRAEWDRPEAPRPEGRRWERG